MGITQDSWDWAELTRFARQVARRSTAVAADAEDVAQEALVRAWRSRGTCRTPDQPKAWLRQIVLNEATRLRQRSAASARVLLNAAAMLHAGEGEDVFADRQTRIDVARALKVLDPLDRALIALRYGADQTQEAIAARMQMAEGTVKVRLHRARVRIRNALE